MDGHQVTEGLDLSRLQAVDGTDGEVHINELGLENLADEHRILVIALLGLGLFGSVERDLLIGEESEVLEWVRMTPKARHAKSKARLNAYDKLLFDDLNFNLPSNGIVGVIGPNGAGKTTLFRLIMGLEQPDSGDFKVGETVKVGYIDQQHTVIDPEKSVWEVVSEGNEQIMMGGRLINSRAYLSRFNFSGTEQNKKAGVLSGGERNRLHLALTLKSEANVLLLDEPTNDIDVNTLRALEEGLENFAGCAVVISHDRWFLDRICTHILAFEGDSQVYFFEGGYTEYEENKKMRLGNVTPKRIRYKKITVT